MATLQHTVSAEIRRADARHHNLPLLPKPSEDERDPLRWPRGLKLAALTVTAFANFTANFAASGLSVATPQLEAQFHKTPQQVNALLTFNFLLLGLGNLFWVPIGVKFGKRASLLTSSFMLFAVLIWTAKETSFRGLLAARCLSGFASAAGESIVPSIVNDIFFLHERAAMMSGYTILVSGASAVGPLIASFVVQYSRGGWVDFVWVCAGLAGANAVAIYVFYPESNFHRPEEPHVAAPGVISQQQTDGSQLDKPEIERTETVSRHIVKVVPKPWTNIWASFVTIDSGVSLLGAFCEPLKMLLEPNVLFAVFVYGTSLAAQIILIFAFPSLLLAPPYLFSAVGVGLMQIAAIIGFIVGCILGGYVTDLVTAAVIRRQGGAVYPEQRLISFGLGCFVAPAGCIVIAFACSEKLHWVAIAFGFGMGKYLSFGTVFAPNIAITYVVESHPRLASEALVTINVFKNLVAFLFLYTAVDWIASQGWVQVYMIMFMLVTLGMLLAIPFYFYGHKWRGQREAESDNDVSH